MFKRIFDILGINKLHSSLHDFLFFTRTARRQHYRNSFTQSFTNRKPGVLVLGERFLRIFRPDKGRGSTDGGRPSPAAVRVESAFLDDRALDRISSSIAVERPLSLTAPVSVLRAFRQLQMSGREGKGAGGHGRNPGKKGDDPGGKVESDGKDKGKHTLIKGLIKSIQNCSSCSCKQVKSREFFVTPSVAGTIIVAAHS